MTLKEKWIYVKSSRRMIWTDWMSADKEWVKTIELRKLCVRSSIGSRLWWTESRWTPASSQRRTSRSSSSGIQTFIKIRSQRTELHYCGVIGFVQKLYVIKWRIVQSLYNYLDKSSLEIHMIQFGLVKSSQSKLKHVDREVCTLQYET